jgi:hypothetical protein
MKVLVKRPKVKGKEMNAEKPGGLNAGRQKQ